VAKFVWLKGLRGPEPQVWHHDQMYHDQREIRPMQSHTMTEADLSKSIDELIAVFPFNPKNLTDQIYEPKKPRQQTGE
jgi:hypothetical protein